MTYTWPNGETRTVRLYAIPVGVLSEVSISIRMAEYVDFLFQRWLREEIYPRMTGSGVIKLEITM